ncbi:hypothetical protein K432DRAFT_410068 [Lepidopterella palustris CBS 459.81]|uniref:Protein transport protein sec73 n=1 Tax=Lepidopterella palustris CBS 459.81 TaxID=1314670 RepID=A0A8E2DZ01_9PEZI|nr:hypothetical protein K432DRAFT_410068 [Lepidopterella palustris CBS 459.81]
MPLKALRANRSERDLQRRSTLDPTGLFKRGDKAAASANLSTEFLAPNRAAASHDGERPSLAEFGRASWSADTHERPSSPPIQEHTPNTRRFSIMRFRHASDSQLSVKAKEHAAASAPPMPAMPAPAIITTAPTIDNMQQPSKKKSRLQQLAMRRRSLDPQSAERPNLRKSMDKKVSSDHKRSTFGLLRPGGSQLVVEEPGRLSASQIPGALTESGDGTNSTLSLPVPRISDSSRSDGSSGDHVTFANAPGRPQLYSYNSTGRFRFPRRNKQRASLFPLPMKITPPEFPDTAPATPRASTSAISSGSPNHSPGEYSPPSTALRSNSHNDQDNGNAHPLPSPSQVALAAASLHFVAPDSTLMRNDSTKSIRSSRSSPNAGPPMRLGLRGRSSTIGSVGGRSDDAPPPTPPFASSGRNSTSTAGRSSLSNLFGLGNRFRQSSEPHSPRHGSPAHGFTGTPGIASHNNSMNISREALVIPVREEGEPAGRYLERLEEVMDHGVIASVMSKTDDSFSRAVLRSFMRKFSFFGDPIDMAIRKLLMEVELPKETQQIDRVLQGFADRYHECNPGIYINPDKAYFISFSIVILHTDFFNKNNKRKMQRPDYIKNSSCEGVSDDVLGCIYDNIIYTPFIHFEDDIDIKGIASRRSKISVFKAPLNDPARKSTKEPIDPYTLIFEGKLDILRPTIKDVMNLDDPYTYLGTAQSLDSRTLYNSFSKYGIVQIVSSRSRPEAFISAAAQENPQETQVGIVEMPVTKVGILWRKDSKRKAARSPWQEWGAILTGSGLSFFKNNAWAKGLMHQHEHHQKQGNTGPVVFKPALQDFKADHVIPTDGTVALVDTSYRKHKHAFVVFSKGGAEETFLADNETELNDWLAKLNYSAAFETMGVRPRGLVGGLYEGQRHRGIRRLESSHSATSVHTATGDVTIRSGKIDNQFQQQMITARRELMQLRISEAEDKLSNAIKQLDGHLRDARHLQILAPVQPKTREMVVHAAGRLAAKLKWIRTEIWRMKCHRDILAMELEEEKNVANERQATIDRTTGTLAPQIQAQPQQSAKASKIGSLARLNSKASTIISGQKPPQSPNVSARPGTKSSRETEFGDDIFKTPPETSRQSSPTHIPGQWELPPLSFSPVSPNHRGSFVSASAQSPSLIPYDHRPSVSTVSDKVGSETASETASRYTTPLGEDAEQRQADSQVGGPSNLDGGRPDTASESEPDRTPAAFTGSPESRSKVRRSLHRTLRDSHSVSAHRRGGKGRDSSSTIVSEDTLESEGLSRAKGSFTVHGKKASVITFGSEWQNMPAEERLKVRKQAQEAVQEVGNGEDEKEMSADDQAISITNESNAAAQRGKQALPDEDATPRASTNEKRRQRQVSSRIVVLRPKRSSVNGHTTDREESEMEGQQEKYESEQDVPRKEASGSKHTLNEEDSGSEQVRLNGPKTQAVEA